MRRFLSSLWNWLYDKIKAVILGYVYGGGLALLVTEGLSRADLTDLSSSERAAVTFGSMALLGLLNGIRRPETRDPHSPLPPGVRES